MISFSNINKQYGKQLIFVDASFQLNPGEKVGLVGPNGAGKTTLFRMIVREESPDEGEVSVPKKLTIGYFRQDVEEMKGRLVLDNRDFSKSHWPFVASENVRGEGRPVLHEAIPVRRRLVSNSTRKGVECVWDES
jgi:ATPase subunit of ABC transporter with duplicated ATPase domains